MGNLLIIDDEVDLCEIHAEYAQNLGWSCKTAQDPAAALGILASFPIDLIMTDMKMPGISGEDFLRDLRLKGFNIPAIICSGSIRAVDDFSSGQMSPGVVAVLSKPLNESKLQDALARLVFPPKSVA